MSRPLRVIGVGSPHGDDAIGLEAVRRLRMVAEHSAEIEFHAVDSGQRLLDLIDAQGSLILIDGLKCEGASPGIIHRLTWPDPRIDALAPGSTHALGAAQALQLAAAVGQLPKQVVIYAMEIGDAEPGDGFSQDVAGALPELLNQVQADIEALRHRG